MGLRVRMGWVSVVGMGWVSLSRVGMGWICGQDGEGLSRRDGVGLLYIEQIRAGSQEFADWIKFSQWRLP